MADAATLPSIAEHGATRLPSVEVDSYNIEIKEDGEFIGDRASKGAFREILERWRADFQVEALSDRELLPHFEACEHDLCVSLMPGTP